MSAGTDSFDSLKFAEEAINLFLDKITPKCLEGFKLPVPTIGVDDQYELKYLPHTILSNLDTVGEVLKDNCIKLFNGCVEIKNFLCQGYPEYFLIPKLQKIKTIDSLKDMVKEIFDYNNSIWVVSQRVCDSKLNCLLAQLDQFDNNSYTVKTWLKHHYNYQPTSKINEKTVTTTLTVVLTNINDQSQHIIEEPCFSIDLISFWTEDHRGNRFYATVMNGNRFK
jgi:hypothetical protein